MTKQNKIHTIIVTAGGTGGHLFPAESLARALMAKGYNLVLSTDERGLKFQTLKDEAIITSLPSATMKSGVISKIIALITILWGVFMALIMLLKHKPSIVIGFGGYPSFPAIFAAQILRIPTILHEQNGVLGKANKFLSKRATKIATSIPDTKGISNPNQNVLTGNPVRPEILALQNIDYKAPSATGKINIFILGGSQGARNFSTIIPKGFGQLSDDLKSRLNIVQQSRAEDLETAKNLYTENGLIDQVELLSFFKDVPKRYENCHLFIGRSGASTVAEIAIIGRPALFLPLMHSDRQQVLNAESLKSIGGAEIILPDNFTAESFSKALTLLLNNPKGLSLMATATRQCACPKATENLASLVEKHLKS